MSSSGREIVVNPLERAVSTDIMRGQNFAQCTLSEFLRALLDTSLGTDDVQAGGLYNPNLTQGNPVAAEIISGLLFTPAVGSAGSVVGAGTVALYDPDTSPSTDDSQYKLVEDPGTSLLTLTGNASGSARFDVIECARVQPDNIVETDSRDVFNTVTGIFTAGTVNKVTQGQLQYRIRLGTPGAGFPGTAAGWLPLAVAYVPTGTTLWDTVTLWDVRPLVADRVFGTSPLSQDLSRIMKANYSTSNGGGVANQMSGVVEVNFGGRRIGGRLRRGSPGTDFGQPYVDFADATNQQAGLTLSGGDQLLYYYLCTPFGLPRWARYTDVAAGSRVPQNPRGIPVVSNVAPTHVYGNPSGAIPYPTWLGSGSMPASAAICFGASHYDFGIIVGSVVADGWCTDQVEAIAVAGSAVPTGTVTFAENTHFPAGCTRVRVLFQLTLSLTGNGAPGQQPFYSPFKMAVHGDVNRRASIVTPTTILMNVYETNLTVIVGIVLSWTVEMELPNEYPTTAAPQSYDFYYDFSAVVASQVELTGATGTIVGWKMGH